MRTLVGLVGIVLAVRSLSACHGGGRHEPLRSDDDDDDDAHDDASDELPPGVIEPIEIDSALRVHSVQAGETLSGIALRYHVPGGAKAIARDNHLSNVDLVRAGSGVVLRASNPETRGLPPLRVVRAFEGAFAPCAADEWPSPTPRAFDPILAARGCSGIDAACAAASDGREVCACTPGTSTDDPFLFTVTDAHGATVSTFRSPILLGGASSFAVEELDLDGDARDELVVAVHRNTGCGMAAVTWDFVVFFADRPSPMRYTAMDQGPESFVARDDGRAGCDAMPSEWSWLHDPLRGDGLYFVRRRFHVAAGALVPVRAPLVVERVGYEGKQRWPVDPVAEEAPLRSLDPAALIAARFQAGLYEPDFLAFELRGGEDGASDDAASPPRIGDRATGVAWPEGYVPSDPRTLVGARVEVARYGREDDAPETTTTVLWLRP